MTANNQAASLSQILTFNKVLPVSLGSDDMYMIYAICY